MSGHGLYNFIVQCHLFVRLCRSWLTGVAVVGMSVGQRISEAVEIPILTRCCFCFPLRSGLILLAYLSLTIAVTMTGFQTYYISYYTTEWPEGTVEYYRVIVSTTELVMEIIMTVMFIIALHKKHVLMMKVFLYFEIVISLVMLVLSLVWLERETGREVFFILFQLTIYIYLVILIRSSIVKMERDGPVKYTRDQNPA